MAPRRKTTKKRKKELLPYQIHAGYLYAYYGIKIAKEIYGNMFTYSQYKYAKKKCLDPDFHPGPWGGARNNRFPPKGEEYLIDTIFDILKALPTLRPTDISFCLWGASPKMIKKILRDHYWSYRKAEVKQMDKFTEGNLNRYIDYMFSIGQYNWEKVKYLDESHVVVQTCRTRRAWFKKGVGNNHIVSTQPYRDAVTLTLICGLNGIFYSMRRDSNKTEDFLEFVTTCFEQKILEQGDILVIDNATVHSGAEFFDEIITLFRENGAFLWFLPTYSPELNPCENIFAIMKDSMRKCWSDLILEDEIVAALKKITVEMIINYFKHCQVTTMPENVQDLYFKPENRAHYERAKKLKELEKEENYNSQIIELVHNIKLRSRTVIVKEEPEF